MANGKLYTVTLTLPDGTRKYFRGKTKKEAEKKRTEMRMKIGMGVEINCTMTVEELANLWFDLYKKDKLHKRSEETIRFILARYILPNLGLMKVADVKPIHIQQLMSSVSHLSNSILKRIGVRAAGLRKVLWRPSMKTGQRALRWSEDRAATSASIR